MRLTSIVRRSRFRRREAWERLQTRRRKPKRCSRNRLSAKIRCSSGGLVNKPSPTAEVRPPWAPDCGSAEILTSAALRLSGTARRCSRLLIFHFNMKGFYGLAEEKNQSLRPERNSSSAQEGDVPRSRFRGETQPGLLPAPPSRLGSARKVVNFPCDAQREAFGEAPPPAGADFKRGTHYHIRQKQAGANGQTLLNLYAKSQPRYLGQAGWKTRATPLAHVQHLSVWSERLHT